MIRAFLRQGRVLRPPTVQNRLRYYTDDKKPAEGLDFGTLNSEIAAERQDKSIENDTPTELGATSEPIEASAPIHETPAKPWYLRDQPEVKEEVINIDLGLPEGAMNDIAKQLARDAIYDLKYIPEQNIIIGSGKSSRHIYKAGREIMGVLKHQHDVFPTAEGLFKKNAQRMSYRRMLKKARKQNLEFPDSEWVVIDSQMGFHVHIFTAEKRELVNLEDLYKFEMDEEEVELTPEDFAWAEKAEKNVIDGDKFLSGQETSDPFLRSDSIRGVPNKPSNNPFDGGIGSGQRRSIHTSALLRASATADFAGEAVEEPKTKESVIPLFMYKRWAEKGQKDQIFANLAKLEADENQRVIVLSSLGYFFRLPTTGFNDVPQAVEEMLGYFSPASASGAEWREVFNSLIYANKVNYKCVPTQAIVDFLVTQQASGTAATAKQIAAVMRATVDSIQYEVVGVTSLVEWQRVVDAKVQILKQVIEGFGATSAFPQGVLGNDRFIRVMARTLSQRTAATFGLDNGAAEKTTKHPLDLRLIKLEESMPIKHMNRKTLYVFFTTYANAYAWIPFFKLMLRCYNETKPDKGHVLMIVSLLLHSRDETAFLEFMDKRFYLLRDAKGVVPLNSESAHKLKQIIDTIDPEAARFRVLRRRIEGYPPVTEDSKNEVLRPEQ